MPRAVSARATRLARWLTAPKVSASSPSTAAVLAGTALAALLKMSPIRRSMHHRPRMPFLASAERCSYDPRAGYCHADRRASTSRRRGSMPRLTETLARRAVERAVADRHAEYVEEMQRIVEATYTLIERTGNLDPPLRDILKETGLSTQAFYRYFQSKDELMLLLLDDGRRQLLSYLEHRMERAASADERVRAWIEGVLTQATRTKAADRTRPFVVNEARLAEGFPEEHRISIDLLIDQLADVLADGSRSVKAKRESRRDAEAIYQLSFATLNHHLIARTRPSAADVDPLVRFVRRGAALPCLRVSPPLRRPFEGAGCGGSDDAIVGVGEDGGARGGIIAD